MIIPILLILLGGGVIAIAIMTSSVDK